MKCERSVGDVQGSGGSRSEVCEGMWGWVSREGVGLEMLEMCSMSIWDRPVSKGQWSWMVEVEEERVTERWDSSVRREKKRKKIV